MSSDEQRRIESAVYRIAGEAKLVLEVNDDDIVENAYFIATAPVRGFERLVKGKNPQFLVQAVMRICGICHVAHAIAACQAVEEAIEVEAPRNARVWREALGLANRIESHILHTILVYRDFAREDNGLYKLIKMLNKACDVMHVLGGAPTHPPFICIGGVIIDNPESRVRKAIKTIESLKNELESVLSEFRETRTREVLENLKVRFKKLATHPYYGDSLMINLSKLKVLSYSEYRRCSIESNTMIALYNDDIVEVGPRARLLLYRGYDGDSLWSVEEARLLEILECINRLIEILESIEPSGGFKSATIPLRRGFGVGVFEAPRGTLVYTVELDSSGRVSSCRIIVPTMFNIPVIERACVGVEARLASLIARLYDPCIPCTTHIVRVGCGCSGF